jgi:hypothetical protein
MNDAIGKLQQTIFRDYASSVGLSADARYYGGSRLRPVVPLDTAIGGYFIIGAYPSAQFESVDGENDVPVGDNLGPFEPQRYFDGSRVRTQASADELAEFYLGPLGVRRSECWVTDLVKVFLFKEGHREKYVRLGVTPPTGYEREHFEDLPCWPTFPIRQTLRPTRRTALACGTSRECSTRGRSIWCRPCPTVATLPSSGA